MNKKYELIADGANKRIKALRSFKVQDRYVNIGDVGGTVYDEKTLSQDGNAWIFRGNYSCPTVRIAGDAVIDTNEVGALGATPLVTIDGESKIVGAALNFDTNADQNVELTPDMFESGTVNYSAGVSWETWKSPSPNFVRLKKPLFMGAGSGQSLKIEVEGYVFQAYWIDRDGNGIGMVAVKSGAGASIAIPSNAVYMYLRMNKAPAATTPADVATAKPVMTRIPREANVLIRDTKVIDTVTGNYYIRMGTIGTEAKYDQIDSSFVNSTIEFTKPIGANVVFTFCTEMVNTHATVDFSGGGVKLIGRFSNVEDLQVSSSVNFDSTDPKALDNCMIAKDCKTLAYNPSVFPGALLAQQAGKPFRFTRCNVPNGLFYNHAQIENTYTDLDFSLALPDLGKTFGGGRKLGSSEIPGMYRVFTGRLDNVVGGVVESHASVTALKIPDLAATYNSIIYADACLSGSVDLNGTCVLGGTRKHDQAQPIRIEGRAVQGMITSIVVGEKVTGVNDANDRVSVLTPFRTGGSTIIGVLAPDNIESQIVAVDAKNVIVAMSSWAAGNRAIEASAGNLWLSSDKAYVAFRVKGGGLLKPEDLKDVSVVEHHGCKIVNTSSTKSVTLKGNIRVEDDAHLINASVEGSGYFGGRSTTSNANIIGSAYMDDNAVYANGEVAEITDLEMRDNAHYEGMPLESIISLTMYDNSACYGTVDLLNGSLFMMDNAGISADATVDAVGSLVMKDNAIVDSTLNTSGRIVLHGDYNQATQKTWKGCRNIDSENAPVYGGNVKTRHDYF